MLVSALMLVLTVSIAYVIIGQFESHLKKSISNGQFPLVSSIADNIDEKLNIAQQALLAAASQIEADGFDPQAAQHYLDSQAALLTLFKNGIFLFSSEGELVAESPFIPGIRGRNYAFREYFKQTVNSGLPVISSPFFSSKNHHHPAIMFTAPIQDAKGNLIAVLGGALDLLEENFLTHLSGVRIGTTGYLYLYDTDRTIIMHPDPSRIMQQDVPVGANLLFDRAIEGFEGTGETVNSRGLHALASFKRLNSTNWILATNYPVAEAYDGVVQAKKFVTLSLVPIASLGLLVSLLSMHYLLRPLQRLTRHVLTLSEKQEEEKYFAFAGSDEIGALAQAFNAFVNQTEGHHAALLEAMNQSETERAKSEAVIAAIGDGLTVKDTDFRILYQNQVSRDLLGDLVGQHCYQTIHQGDQPIPECALAQAFQDGRIHSFDLCLAKGQQAIHVEITASPIRSADGKIVAGIELMRDVTERRRAEGELRNSEYLLNEAQRIAHVGSFDLDLTTLEQRWSEELYRIHQLSPDTPVTYETVFNYNPPEDRSRIEKAVELAIHETGQYDFEHTIIRPDGTTRMMRAIGRVIYDESGQPVRMIGACQDITERKQDEEHIRQLSLAVEQSPTIVIITDLEAKIVYTNPCFTKTTGYRAEEVIGRNPSLLSCGHTAKEVYHELWETLLAGKIWQGEFRNKKKTGELYWEQALLAPIRDATGVTTHYLAIKEDVTERRALENQLRHSQKMEAIGQLLAGIAHDFNNILTAIVGYASHQQLKAEEGSDLKNDLGTIIAASNRGAGLIKDLMTFSRKRTVCMERCDLNQVIQNSLSLLRQLFSKEIEVTLTLASTRLAILADGNHLEQVLINLATNARDAMPDGGQLFISTEPVYLNQEFVAHQGYGIPGPYALLSVCDTGDGMEKETINRIFEPFYSTKEVGKGTGLGLSIIYGIIKQHKGYIICHSGPGKGTSFRIFLPLGLKEKELAALPCYPLSSGENAMILLAEEENNQRKLTLNLLEEFGFRVAEAKDGEEVIARLRDAAEDIRCLVINALLPNKRGIELHSQIRAIRPDVKIIFCSGDPAEDTEEKKLIPQGSVYLRQPFSPNQLLSKIREVLNNDQA